MNPMVAERHYMPARKRLPQNTEMDVPLTFASVCFTTSRGLMLSALIRGGHCAERLALIGLAQSSQNQTADALGRFGDGRRFDIEPRERVESPVRLSQRQPARRDHPDAAPPRCPPLSQPEREVEATQPLLTCAFVGSDGLRGAVRHCLERRSRKYRPGPLGPLIGPS
jgi:hypothetical protein